MDSHEKKLAGFMDKNNIPATYVSQSELLERNSRRTAYIKKVREDGKFDISLQLQGFLHVIDSHCEKILKRLETSGDLFLTDKSSPEEILEAVQLSKKAFKKAIGVLYKKKKIKLEKDRITLL